MKNTTFLQKKCPKCKEEWGEFKTICGRQGCDYERGFFVWLYTGGWGFGAVILTTIVSFVIFFVVIPYISNL